MISKYERLKSTLTARCNQVYASTPYPVRFHKDIELLYIEEGCLEIQLDMTQYRLEAGDLCAVFPNILHSITEQCCTKCLIMVSPALIPDFSKLLSQNKPLRPVLRANELPEIVAHLCHRCSQLRPTEKDRSTLLCHINSLLSEILQIMPLQQRSSDPGLVQKIVEFILSRYTDDISLEQLAQAVGYSKYHVSRCLNDTFGCNFRTLVNNYRINAAEEMLLHSDKTITSIAYACGFPNQSSFNRAFLKYCGMKPTQYRKAHFVP